jgi:hypothetical protein
MRNEDQAPFLVATAEQITALLADDCAALGAGG